MRRNRQFTLNQPSARRVGARRSLHIERLEHRSMLAADAGFVDAGLDVDPIDVDPTVIVCPGVPEPPTIDVPEQSDVYEDYNRFLEENPDWLADHGADGIQACVMTPSTFVYGVELANPGEARAFDAWFEQEHPWRLVDLDIGDDSILPEGPVEFDDTDGDSSGTLRIGFFPPSFNFIGVGGWMISSVAGGPVGGVSPGFTTTAIDTNSGTGTLTGTEYLDGSSWLSFFSRSSDFGLTTLTLSGGDLAWSGGEVVRRPSFAPEARSAAFASPFGTDQSAFAQFAASFMGGSAHDGDTAAESLPGGGGRRRARN